MQEASAQNSEPAPNQQIQEGFIMKNYKNIGLLVLLCVFIFFFVMVFYFFIYMVYEEEEEETSSSFQYQITQYARSGNVISIVAQCIDCQTYYLKKTNYVAQNLNITIILASPNHLNIVIKGIDFPYQYEVPHKLPFTDFKSFLNFSESYYEYEITTVYNPMRFIITRSSTGESIFDTSNYEFIYSRFYIKISTTLPSNYLYGLGERNEMFSLQNGSYSIWNRVPQYNVSNTTEIQNSTNTFGSQPIYLMREKNSTYHMVYLRNFNAMDIVFNNSEDDLSLQYRLVKLSACMFCLGDENPEHAVRLSNDYLGGYMFPPLWAFGLTHMISNYSSIDDLTSIIQSYQTQGMNLEVMWLDFEYQEDGNAFTIDTGNFPKDSMNEILETTKLIANIGPCIKVESSSTAYTTGVEEEIFLEGVTGETISGYNRKVGTCYYPDFFNPDTLGYWLDMLTTLNSVFNFSGIWLDDNEIYDLAGETTYGSNISSYDYYVNYSELPYLTGSFPLEANTIDLNALHYENIKEFDVHSMYGILQTFSTFTYLNETKSIPFVYLMTGANSVGFSKFSGHFQDFLPFEWITLKYYLSNMLNYNLFGSPFMGGIICNGLSTVTSEDYDAELCARWIQLSTFSPLFLVKTQPDENIFLEEDLLTVFQDTITLRNSFIPFMYSTLLNSTGNGTLLRPLFFTFPNDTMTFNSSNVTNSQFTVGKAMMVTPILEQSVESAFVYFPSANWYDFDDCTQLLNMSQEGRFIEVNNTVSDTVPLFIRGGNIVSRSSQSSDVLNLTNENIILHIAFDKNSSGYYVSEGKILGFTDLYNDSALLESCFQEDCLITVRAEGSVTVTATQTHYEIKLSFNGDIAETLEMYITSAIFYGLTSDACLSFNLGTSYQLKVPYSFTMNIYE